MTLDIVILAAGKGTRMKSEQAKVLHFLGEKPLITHVVQVAQSLNPQTLISSSGSGIYMPMTTVSIGTKIQF